MRIKIILAKDDIINAIAQHSFKKDVAKALDVSPTTLWRRAVELGVKFPLRETRETRAKRPWQSRKSIDELVSPVSIVERLIRSNEIKHECNECGQPPMWNGKPLTLQIDHIDGDPTNNTVKNLRLLCPHCHTQTPTWGFKKRSMVTLV